MSVDFRLDGAVAVVTGAAGRLGSVWMHTLSEAGAAVAGIDISNGLGTGPGDRELRLEVADVTDRSSLDAAAERIERELGPPAVLVNNAGIDQPPHAAAATHAVEDIPLAEFQATLEVNLAGAFNAIQAFGPGMRDRRRGSIVNIASLYASVAPNPRLYDHLEADPPFLKPPAYGASKAGLINLTSYFARLWGPHGVRVNALSPGGVQADQDPEFVRKYSGLVPLGRMAEAADLTGPLLFLASDASRYVNGHNLQVDGGFTA